MSRKRQLKQLYISKAEYLQDSAEKELDEIVNRTEILLESLKAKRAVKSRGLKSIYMDMMNEIRNYHFNLPVGYQVMYQAEQQEVANAIVYFDEQEDE